MPAAPEGQRIGEARPSRNRGARLCRHEPIGTFDPFAPGREPGPRRSLLMAPAPMRFRRRLLCATGLLLLGLLLVLLDESRIGRWSAAARVATGWIVGLGVAGGLGARLRPAWAVPCGYGALAALLAVFAWHPLIEALVNLQTPAAVAAVISALGLTLGRRRAWRSGLCTLVLAAWLALPDLSLWTAPRPQVTGEPPLTVGALNLLWHNQPLAGDLAPLAGADLLGLVEVSREFRAREARKLADTWPHQWWWPVDPAAWDEQTWGLAILSKHPIDERRIFWPNGGLDDFHPVLSVRFRHRNGTGGHFSVTHLLRPRADAAGRARRAASFSGLVEHAWPEDAILVGDLNATSASPLFRALTTGSRLHDSRRGFGPAPTWPAGPADIGLGLDLDHVLVGPAWGTIARETRRVAGSDHRAVLARLGRAVR